MQRKALLASLPRLRWTTRLVAASASATLAALILAATGHATDYYVNSGSSCPGSGTSGSPYCSFSSVNSIDFASGDRILLARGATFNVSTGPPLLLGDEDDGASIAWNSVEPYGSGADPIITGADVDETVGVRGTDLDYWRFSDIDFRNASNGILAEYHTLTHSGLRFEKLYFHDMIDALPWSGGGIGIYSAAENLAKSATASASSTDTVNGYCACRINDGKTGDFNGWSNSQALPQWVELAWGSSKTIDKVVFTTTTGYITQAFQIQYWNGSTWVTPSGASITGNTEKTRVITFSPVSTQKIRAYITTGDQNGTARVDELAAYNSASVPVPGPSQWVLKDIQITDTEFGPIGLYLGIDGINSQKLESFQDIIVMRNYTHDVNWDMAFRYVKNVKWISNRDKNIATEPLYVGATDLHLWAVHNATFVNSIFDTLADTGSYDQTFADIAYRMDETRFRNNLIQDAAGPGIEWHVWRIDDDYGLDSTTNYYSNQEISGNVFRNNGWDTTPITPNITEGGMSLAVTTTGCGTLPTGTVSDNLYWEPTGFFTLSGCSQPMTMTNNLSIGASDDIYHAGQTFSEASCSTSPWSYEASTDGSTWTAMSTLNTVNARTDVRCQPSSGSVPWVSRFEQHPNTGSSYTVARTWTAPKTGTVSIRSRALKAELGGDGVTVRVTKNGTPIISATSLGANDQDGVVLKADSVSVTSGDKVRFEVDDGSSNTNDRISWSPAIGYKSTTYSASTNFSSTQAQNQWTYQYAANGAYTYTNLANYDSPNSWWEKATTQPPTVLIGSSWQHPDGDDSVRTWTAPLPGSISITSNGNVRLSNSPVDGTDVKILKNGSSTAIWSATISDTTGVSMGTVGPVTVAAGDQIHFRVNQRSSATNDATIWDPTILFTPSNVAVTYIASERFREEQGGGQWTYQYAASGAYTYTNLASYDTPNSWWEKATTQPPTVLIGSSWQHPDGDDSVRTWTAPEAGSIVITNNGGNVRLSNSPVDGTDVKILKNGSSTAIWSATISDTTGVSMGTVGPVTVAAGDQIHFRVEDRSSATNDATIWDPKIVFTSDP